jgi:hypothetical protein
MRLDVAVERVLDAHLDAFGQARIGLPQVGRTDSKRVREPITGNTLRHV